MPRAKKATLEQRVPKALEEIGQATAAQMLKYLGIKTADRAGRNQVYRLLWDLVELGRATVVPENLAAGFFWVPEKPRRIDLQAKLRRAVGLRQRKYGGFTRSDLMALTLAKDRDYTKRLVLFWWNLGLLLLKDARNGEPVYQLAPGVSAEQLPHWNRRAEETKRRAGIPPASQSVPLAITAIGKGVQETMQTFASGLRAAVAAHNEEVEKMLQEMEADVAQLAAGETPAPPGPERGAGDEAAKD